jgi:hypothetical protein
VKVTQSNHFHVMEILIDLGWYEYQTVIDADAII